MTAKKNEVAKGTIVLLFLILVLNSCTYDYFEDENNFRLYVPQIENGSIQNFYVSFHDVSGSHHVTRELTPPFDKDELMKQGILRFKLYPGQYNITCFADYTPGSITIGNDLENSSKNKDVIDISNNIFASNSSNPRALLCATTIFPIGHPNSKDKFTANIDEQQCYKGRLKFSITNLPDIITRIEIVYKGLATRYFFSGQFGSFSPDDKIRVSFNVADYRVGNVVDFTDVINPSIGSTFGSVPAAVRMTNRASSPTPMDFQMFFYDNENNLIGTTVFDVETLQGLADDKKPKDAYGNPVSSLVLAPQATISFKISDFMIIKIELEGWGDTNQGEITPI